MTPDELTCTTCLNDGYRAWARTERCSATFPPAKAAQWRVMLPTLAAVVDDDTPAQTGVDTARRDDD